MTHSALVLAAHGSRHEPCVNGSIVELAARVQAQTAFDEVACAFHQGSPHFSEVLDSLAADAVTVVPVMTSAGWYCDTVLPRELGRNRRFPNVSLRITAPVGLHPGIASLIHNRSATLMHEHSLIPDQTTLALVGHGSPRHPASRRSTFAIVDQLRSLGVCGEVIATFLDDEPAVDLLPEMASHGNVLVIPFLIAAGPHATRDLPRRIGLMSEPSAILPQRGTVEDKTVVYDIPFGVYPELSGLIADLALSRVTATDLPGRTLEQSLA